MLTCSVAAAVSPGSSFRSGQKMLPLLYPSSKPTSLLSLKQCVHKLVMTQQQRFTSFLSSSASTNSLRRQHQRPTPGSAGCMSWGTRRYYSCYLLNLNHHINFHYINKSILTTSNHHYFHQSTVAAGETAANDSITATATNSLCHNDIVNNSQTELEFLVEDELQEPGIKMSNDNGTGEEWEDKESLKERVWSVGPALLPTFNVGAYANESENVRKLLQHGIDISQWEGRYGTVPLLYKTDFETTMLPVIEFLKDIGVDSDGVSRILSKNPFLFNEDLGNLEKRVQYLRIKQFSDAAILNIIVGNVYWLSFSVPRIDRRLGFFQTFFGLTGAQVRQLASMGTSGPRLITYNLPHVKDVTFAIKEEMGFTSEEVITILLDRPRLWVKESIRDLRNIFNYLHNEENFSHEMFVKFPGLFRTRVRRLRERIGFLRKLGRAQFDPTKPNYISLERVCSLVDSEWATKVAGVSAEEYNEYLRTL